MVAQEQDILFVHAYYIASWHTLEITRNDVERYIVKNI